MNIVNNFLVRLSFVALFLSLFPTTGSAAMYALGQEGGNQDGSAPVSLYSIDSATGTATQIGSTGLPLRGLAANPLTGRLYAVDSAKGSGGGLYEVDKTTGAAALIGGTFIGASMSFGKDGTLYAITPHNGGNAENHQIFTLDLLTGAEIFFVEISHNDYGGLAVTANGDTITYIGDNGVESVDIATKIVTPVTDWYDDLGGDPGRIAYDANGTLYGVGTPTSAGALYTIDVETESVTQVGQTGIHIYGLTFDYASPRASHPVPSVMGYGLLLMILGMIFIAARQFRRPDES